MQTDDITSLLKKSAKDNMDFYANSIKQFDAFINEMEKYEFREDLNQQ
jgi:hypothetical protein